MMATTAGTTSYSARKRIGGISARVPSDATGMTPPRPRTTPRIGGPAAKLASGTISYLQPDPAGTMPLGMPWAGSPFGMAGGMNHPYGYAAQQPFNYIDPDAGNPIVVAPVLIEGAVLVGGAAAITCLMMPQQCQDIVNDAIDLIPPFPITANPPIAPVYPARQKPPDKCDAEPVAPSIPMSPPPPPNHKCPDPIEEGLCKIGCQNTFGTGPMFSVNWKETCNQRCEDLYKNCTRTPLQL